MKIRIPNRGLNYMKPLSRSHTRTNRGTLTMNTLIVAPELLARPQFEPEPPTDVVRVIDNTAEGGGSHE